MTSRMNKPSATPIPVAALGRGMMSTSHSEWERRYSSARAAIQAQHDPADVDHRDGVAGDLRRLCWALVEQTGQSGAAVTLMDRTGSQGVAAASDDRNRALAELQFTTGEGPCHEAFAAGRPVLVADLQGSSGERWPGFRSAALESGIGAVFVFPLQVGAVALGVLDVYALEPGPLTAEQVATILTYAQIATEILLDGTLTTSAGDLTPGLATALDGRAEIHQAQGMVMVALGVTLAEALVRMRAHAFASTQPLIDLAHEIIAGRSPFDTGP